MQTHAIAAKFQRLLCVGLATLIVGSSLLFGFSTPAVAVGNDAGDVVQSRAERELDRVAGSGTANEIEGRAKEDIGRVQRQVDKVTGGVDGIGNQVQGRAQKDIGRTQGAVEDAAEAAEDSADGLIDSIKGFFGN